MEGRKWILLTVSTVATVVIVSALVFLLLRGTVSNGYCTTTVNLHHPMHIGENVWVVEVRNVTGSCPPEGADLERVGALLERNGSTIASAYQLHNGLVSQADPILIFFADQGKVGRVDAGDLFYLVNLELESQYDFYALDGGGTKRGHVLVYT
ncbi:MAG: hypothetical protein LN416_03975 [Candidatus Thermoplasmatota archaeon]|nr:hypothetical protein [Candidatus Thermoplasmatota archaeon]